MPRSALVAQQNRYLSQGGTVVLEKLVPELVLPPAVMGQRTAGKDNQAEQLITVAGSALPTARDGQEMIKLVQVADAKIDIPINYVKLMCSVFAK